MYQTNSEIVNPLPVSVFPFLKDVILFEKEKIEAEKSVYITDNRYTIRLAENQSEINELLKLRYQIFKVETGKDTGVSEKIETDEYDSSSHHLIAVENKSEKIIGGYRLRTTETNTGELGFYSAGEFQLNDLPREILDQSVEIGRACIASEYRNGKVLFLLWKGLAKFISLMNKRYLFGCCSLFSGNFCDGLTVYGQLANEGFLHKQIKVSALNSNFFENEKLFLSNDKIELPKLFNTYLRIGAKVCSLPVVDREFGTIDFFVIFDSRKINEKYRRIFFD